MSEAGFEWDEEKAASNERKHGVSFEEAESVFADPLSTTVYDDLRSTGSEDRFVTIGQSDLGRTLVVAHCERGTRTRIISAREATPRERRDYEAST